MVVIDRWLETARNKGVLDGLMARNSSLQIPCFEKLLYPKSVQRANKTVYVLARFDETDMLGIFCRGTRESEGFHGIKKNIGKGSALFCPLDHENAKTLRKVLPFTAPARLAGHGTSFGTGDRLGIAAPGHIHGLRNYRVWPVLAQQSVREIELTSRSFEDVLDSVTWAVFREGFTRPWGADGDHLKTEEWVMKVLALGYSMITADVSAYIKEEYERASSSDLRASFERLPKEVRRVLESNYFEKRIEISRDIIIHFSSEELVRAALIYWDALQHAARLYRAGVEICGDDEFDFELSIDETATPTTPLAHAFIAMELQRRCIRPFSIAPRFIGSFQKAVDYIGDADKFASSLKVHVTIAKHFGYRISVHSGSDKFRIYPAIGEIAEGRFHLKTSGTSWLEALKVIGEVDPFLFYSIYEHAKENAPQALRFYRIKIQPDALPESNSISKKGALEFFESPDVRKLLHISYGEILKHPELRTKIYAVLKRNIEEYWKRLEVHIASHLECLGLRKNTGERDD